MVGVAAPSTILGISRRPSRPLARLVAGALLVVSGICLQPPPAVAEQPAQSSAALEAADESSAALLAYRKRKPVLVTGLTTESTLTWAMPDGTFKAEVQSGPVRTRDADGDWVDVDLNLVRRSDGSVAPGAHPRDLWLSGARSASSTDFVALGSGDGRATLGWRGALPEPTLDGTRATYAEVKPGVDLVVDVTRTGFEYSLRVKTPQAAAELATVAMPWHTGSLAPVVLPDGTSSAQSRTQAEVEASDEPLVVSEALMWDAQTSPAGEPTNTADVTVTTQDDGAGGTDLVLAPDTAFYTDPATQYPVTIDPTINLSPAYDGYVQSNVSVDDKSGETQLKIGYSNDAGEGCGSGCTARSFLSFHNLDGYQGASVVSAELFLWNFHSWSCTAAEWEAWQTTYVNYTARWGSQPTWKQKDGTSMGTKGYSSSCADGQVSISVKKTFAGAFSAGDSTANVGLRATSESSTSGWKKFNSSEASSHIPYVTLVYNRTPNVPTNLKIDSCYAACGSPAVVRSGTPTLTATVSDPDGGTLRAEYEVFDNALVNQKARSGTAVTGVTSGTAKPWRVVPLSGATLPDATYKWRVRACDSYVCGAWSSASGTWFTFTVDTANVAAPDVSGNPYTAMSTGQWNGGPGQPGTFTFTPGSGGSTDVAEYVYSLNSGNSVTVPAGAAQAQQLTANQQQVDTDLTGFTASTYTVIFRSTSRGHGGAVMSSLQTTPAASGCCAGAAGDTYASLGGDYGGMRLGMQAGKRYWITGWIYVPAATGLSPLDSRGLRIVANYKDGGVFSAVNSAKPSAVEAWQYLSVVMTVPATATDAFVRLYNGFATGTGKSVFWDDLSVREMVGTTTAETITPTVDGVNRLEVSARNSAGTTTTDPKVYDFLVTPSTGSWNWRMDEGTGTTAASVPDDFPATFTGTGVTWQNAGRVGAYAVTLAGTGGLTTSSPVLDTTAPAGFTVAAWVRATDLTASRTVVAQVGTNGSMFRLRLRNDRDLDGDQQNDPEWCFTVTDGDTTGATETDACTTDYVVEGNWVSLVGVFDSPNNKIGLYVNGSPQIEGAYAETAYTGGWSATGNLLVGRALAAGALSEQWVGDLDHVYASRKVWSTYDVNSFYGL